MHIFEVWAPKAKSVAVKVNAEVFPLRLEERGYWRGSVESAQPGNDYGFIVDDSGKVLPDPRSPWQPSGVHGLSRILDHSAFAWTDRGWQAPPLDAAIIYELHIGTFSPEGNFEGAIQKLDYLLDLGITHVEIMPVNEFSGGRGWGYDGVDLYAPHHAYGGPEGLKKLVDACHRKGLAVLLDVVYNHLGPSGNYISQFGPYFTDTYHTPWGQAVNLDDAGSPEVRRFLCDNALMWLRDYHVDGLRLDAIHAFHDESAIHFLEQLSIEVDALERQLGRHLILIAESDLNQPRIVTSREANGYGIDAQWSDDFHHALHAVLTGEKDGYYSDFGSLQQLAKALTSVFVYDGQYAPHRQRIHGRPVSRSLSGSKFLAYLQNHDQIGNRARGDRSVHLLSDGRARIGAALVLLSPFLPMLFQGEEFGSSSPFQYFTDHEDEDLANAVTEGRKREFAAFGWKPEDVPGPQEPDTFERSKLHWGEVEQDPHKSMLTWHRELILLRRSNADLTDGRWDKVKVEVNEEKQQLTMVRGPFSVVCNLAETTASIPAADGAELVLAADKEARIEDGHLRISSDSVAILKG